jgi:acetyltransferase-like isoleucine patch superfamily enzyme
VTLLNWIQRRNTPLQRSIYDRLRALHSAEIPMIPGLYRMLVQERELRLHGWRWLRCKLYHQPLLKAQCAQVGVRLELYDNLPKIIGSLHISLGNHVRLEGEQVWISGRTATLRELTIGDHSYLGYGTQLVVGNAIRIGSHVLIANRVLLNGFDGHVLDPLARARNEPPGPDSYGPIVVEDYAWIGSNATILKNVTIGRGAVVASGAVVTRDVSELTVVAGNPAHVVRTIDPPPQWHDLRG